MKMYMVGGAVRDEILGVPSKDIDYSVVLEPGDTMIPGVELATADPYRVMVSKLKQQGFRIFQETPEHLTVRAQFPRTTFSGPVEKVAKERPLTADFVLARKEGVYTDGRRPDSVEPGTLHDDLARRDFTMNAIAVDGDHYIDPFNGRGDIDNEVIRCVGDPNMRLEEDALRAVRALRFKVTTGFTFAPDLDAALVTNWRVHDAIQNKISDERIREELSKMFRYDTTKSVLLLSFYPALTMAMFSGTVSLDATMKTKGRNGATRKETREQGKPKLTPAKGGCTCHCHTERGVMHMVACCR